MPAHRRIRVVQAVAAAIAVLFGIATLLAGGRVLLGSDPGYEVFRPLLISNTAMGVAYLAAGAALWHSASAGRNAARDIFLLNLLVLAGILMVYANDGGVAVDSLRAMSLRTGVWLLLFLAAGWAARRGSAA